MKQLSQGTVHQSMCLIALAGWRLLHLSSLLFWRRPHDFDFRLSDFDVPMAIQQTFDFLDTPPEPNALASGRTWIIATSRKPEASACGSVSKQQTSRQQTLDQLRAQAGCISTLPDADGVETLSTGSDAIDDLLPRGGLRAGALAEWVAQADGCGASALAVIAARARLDSPRGRGPLVVVSPPNEFYPPAAVALGIPEDRMIWVQPTRHADAVWAIDQALRCESVAAVWASIGATLDDRDARRFQLAAETGRTPGLFVRPAAVRGRPSFADVRLYVGNHTKHPAESACRAIPAGRILRVTLDRCRGGTAGRSVSVRIDDQARIHRVTPQQLGISNDETTVVRLASELAHPKTADSKADRRGA